MKIRADYIVNQSLVVSKRWKFMTDEDVPLSHGLQKKKVLSVDAAKKDPSKKLGHGHGYDTGQQFLNN